METNNKTFQELYKEAVNAPQPPTPRELFLQHMADITGRSVNTIYSWAVGTRQPDIIAAKAIANALGTDWHILFPKKKEQRNKERIMERLNAKKNS